MCPCRVAAVMIACIAVGSYAINPPAPFTQTGIASFYSHAHHGKTQANGEPFDQNAMTCAHKTLPFGTRVAVTNLSNGKTVILEVTDRGPYHKDRILDVSLHAARILGFEKRGLAHVKLEVADAR